MFRCLPSTLRSLPLKSLSLAAMLSLSMIGCSESNAPQTVTGPIEGKRLDAPRETEKTDIASATKAADDANAKAAAQQNKDGIAVTTPDAVVQTDKQKRDEWRDKKTGRPDPDDAVAKANITLRPSLANPKDPGTPANPTTRPVAPKPEDGQPVDPTAFAKPLTDPDAPLPYFDPDNPDFIPADRTLHKKFDIAKLNKIDDYLVVPFGDLSGFPYTGMIGAPEPEPDPNAPEGADKKDDKPVIPKNIQALHRKKIMVAGYMMPIDFENGGTNEFVLTRQVPSCFYCVPPQLNDWVEVKMKDGQRVPYVPDGLIELYGEIEVGEVKEDGFVVAMYRMTGFKVVEAKQN